MMERLHVNSVYRDLLHQLALVRVRDFLDLSGVIYSGHPDRNVARVDLGSGVTGFLKKEHRVPWRDRLVNAWAGFGFVSKSLRESAMLQRVAEAGVGCPDVIAAGEAKGRSFLLVRAEPDAADLRQCLRNETCAATRRTLAGCLGETLARLHDAGFVHGDLYAKHVLVRRDGVTFLDWQRARRLSRVSWSLRRSELAALDATLADDVASARERLCALHAYLRRAGTRFAHARSFPRQDPTNAKRKQSVGRIARAIRAESARLLARRSVREQRCTTLRPGAQSLQWLDGEALCLTGDFLAQIGERVPDGLRLHDHADGVEQITLDIAEVGPVELVRRWQSAPWRWLWARFRRRGVVTPELRQGATLFRLERYGIPAPRLLGFGQRALGLWRTASFLLLEPVRGTVSLGAWLAEHPSQRARLAERLRTFVRRLHEAGYRFRDPRADSFAVHQDGEIVLKYVDGLKRLRRIRRRRERRDMDAVAALLEGQVRT